MQLGLALSEAAVPGAPLSACKIGSFLGDPENPPCARLVLSGDVVKVAANSTEETAAKAANKVKVRTQWGVGRTGQEKSLTDFQKKRDAKYPNTPGAGHMWAKAKNFSYRDARDGGDAMKSQARKEAGKR